MSKNSTKLQTMSPPIDLLHHFFTKIEISAIQNLTKEQIDDEAIANPENVSIDFTPFQNNDDSNLFKVILKISSEDGIKPRAYDFNIEVIGIFKLIEKFPEDRISGLINILAPSILYGSAREYLLILTGRMPYGELRLPTISFIPVSDESCP